MKNTEDLTGKIFGRLTVLNRVASDKFGSSCWNCICTCGRYTTVTGHHLKIGNTKSCGCLSGILADFKGKTVGVLTVLNLAPSRRNHRVYWKCRCKCGNILIVNHDRLRHRTIQRCTCQPKEVTWQVTPTGCWECTSHRTQAGGYSIIVRDGKPIYLHRWMYLKYKGEIPEGLNVLHKCDNPKCINPDHLFLGTKPDIACTTTTKNRDNKASDDRVVATELTESQIREILNTRNVTFDELATKYNVTRPIIWAIKTGRRWKHLKACDNKQGTDQDKSLDLKEQRFDKLVAKYPENKDKFGRILWHCQCDCGKTKTIAGYLLVNGNTKSCGCLKVGARTKHNCSICGVVITGRINNCAHCSYCHRIYTCWKDIKSRCNNPNHIKRHIYLDRKISVCSDWQLSFLSFYNWAIANGYQPHLTIDRINNDGNYEPSNCRWATMLEQRHNQRKRVK